MDAPRRIELDYRVRFDEAGPDGQLRSSGYLRYAQDIAWQHSDVHGFDRAWYAERRLLWLVRCVDLQISGGVANGALAHVTTEVVGARRVWARRRAEVTTEGAGDEGRAADRRARVAAVVQTDWVLMRDDGRPARVPPEITARFSDGTSFEPGRVPLGDPGHGARRVELDVRPQDLDPMAHVNNATYVDYVEEVLAAARDGHAGRPGRFQLEYLRPAGPRERLSATAWRDDAGWAVLLHGERGDTVLRARVS